MRRCHCLFLLIFLLIAVLILIFVFVVRHLPTPLIIAPVCLSLAFAPPLASSGAIITFLAAHRRSLGRVLPREQATASSKQ